MEEGAFGKMLIISCMRSASTSFLLHLKTILELPEREQFGLNKKHRVRGYINYPSSTAYRFPVSLLKDLVLDEEAITREHLLPIEHHRKILMSIPEEKRKVVVLKRSAKDSWLSQMRRKGLCSYDSRGKKSKKCLEEFIRFRGYLDVMFPEENGFLHVEFEDLISFPYEQTERVLDYWGYDTTQLMAKAKGFPHIA